VLLPIWPLLRRVPSLDDAPRDQVATVVVRIFYVRISRGTATAFAGKLAPKGRGPISKTVGALADLFPAKAGPTKKSHASSGMGADCRTGFSREAVDSALDLDLHTQEVQTPPIATWVQAERWFCAVGRAAGMRRERRQDMDVRSARAHGARPE